MRRYIAARLVLLLPSLFFVSVFVFIVTHILPGDPAILILGGSEGLAGVKDEDLRALRDKLGTNRPLYVQYLRWLERALRGDLGTSTWYGTPIIDELSARLPVSIELALMGFVIANVIALPLGCLSAVKQDSLVDYGARVLSIAGLAVPYFWLAILTVYFSVRMFNWIPPIGYAALWADPLKNLQQMALPALVLGLADSAFVARITRSTMLDVLREDYIRTARAKGLLERSIVLIHGLPNALLPVVTISGWTFARLMGGTVITETVFLVPGMGNLLVESISHRDLPLIQAIILLVALMILVINLLVDLLCAWLDPRTRSLHGG